MCASGISWQAVLDEIDKCQPVCANCHRIKTIAEAGKMQGCDIDEHIPDNMKHLRADLVSVDVSMDPS